MKPFFPMIARLARRVWLFPQFVADAAFKQRRRQAELDELEVERLDRIRNPEKYLGK
jgi:hypothetical protein